MRIAVAADHAGYALKERIAEHLRVLGHDVVDFGTSSENPTDYPDYGGPAAQSVGAGDADRGVFVCGSGQGMTMVANAVRGVRAALAWRSDIAELSRQHNDANVLCLPARFIGADEALAIVDLWLATPFEGGRHARRVEKISHYEGEE